MRDTPPLPVQAEPVPGQRRHQHSNEPQPELPALPHKRLHSASGQPWPDLRGDGEIHDSDECGQEALQILEADRLLRIHEQMMDPNWQAVYQQ